MFKYFLRILQIKWGKGLYAGIGETKDKFLVMIKKKKGSLRIWRIRLAAKEVRTENTSSSIGQHQTNFRYLISFLDGLE
jgi:hypothetical protein